MHEVMDMLLINCIRTLEQVVIFSPDDIPGLSRIRKYMIFIRNVHEMKTIN